MSSFASRYKYIYISHRDLWIYRLYLEISNLSQKQCLTIDTRDGIDIGPAKFRTQADSDTEQICYYNRNKKDTSCNSFLALQKQTSSASKITFSITKVIAKTNRRTLYIVQLTTSSVKLKMTSFNKQLNDLVKTTLTQTTKNQTDDNVNLQVMEELTKCQDFIQDNNPVGKRYTTNRIKSINFLSNITYVEINKEDFYNENFIFDVYLLVTKNLNPFSLDRKLADKNKHEMIYMLWKKYMPRNFYRHICKEQNFLYLKSKNALQSKALEIIHDFLKESDNNYKDLRNNLFSYKNIFKYVYSNVFSEIYCSTERRGFDLKSDFHIIFKTYKDKK